MVEYMQDMLASRVEGLSDMQRDSKEEAHDRHARVLAAALALATALLDIGLEKPAAAAADDPSVPPISGMLPSCGQYLQLLLGSACKQCPRCRASPVSILLWDQSQQMRIWLEPGPDAASSLCSKAPAGAVCSVIV